MGPERLHGPAPRLTLIDLQRLRLSRTTLAGFTAGLAVMAVVAVGLVVLGPRLSFRPGGGTADGAVVARGAELYATYCHTCHGDSRGIGARPGVPSHGSDGHTWHHSDRNIRETILNGSSGMADQMEEELAEMRRQLGDEIADIMRKQMGLTEGAPRMPAWSGTLSDSDVEAVLAYIKTFWTPEQLRTQQAGPMMP